MVSLKSFLHYFSPARPAQPLSEAEKQQIEALIQDIAGQGISVLLISSELEDLVRNCHRVIVIRDGKNIGELESDMLSEGNIMRTIAQDILQEGGACI